MALVLVVAAVAIPVAAQTTVALIDVQQVVRESDRGKEAFQKLRELQEQKLEQAKQMQQEIDALRDQFSKQRLTLSQEKLEELRKQIEDKGIALKRFQDDAQREIDDAQRKELEKLELTIMPVVDEIGKEKGLTLIFDKFRAGLLYADEAVDITEEVIQRYNTVQ
jgi:outer membrane protein